MDKKLPVIKDKTIFFDVESSAWTSAFEAHRFVHQLVDSKDKKQRKKIMSNLEYVPYTEDGVGVKFFDDDVFEEAKTLAEHYKYGGDE